MSSEPIEGELDPVYRLAEETQRELQKIADEAQDAIERAGVWDMRESCISSMGFTGRASRSLEQAHSKR